MAMDGCDDLDLEGNWAPLGTADSEKVPGPGKGKKKGRKRKRPNAAAAKQLDATENVQASPAEDKAKKRRKCGAGTGAGLAMAPACEELRARACARLQASWMAEAKASKLTLLEAKEVVPAATWFLACEEDAPLADLPKQVRGDAAASSPLPLALLALRAGAELPAPGPAGISITVLTPSAERVFAALAELREAEAWHGARPLALAAHGGGRKRDQVARQAKALAVGASVAVATPGRLLRLLDEGHVRPFALGTLVLDLARDRKQRDLLGMPETRRELFLLLRRYLIPLLGQGEGPRLLLCGGPASLARA